MIGDDDNVIKDTTTSSGSIIPILHQLSQELTCSICLSLYINPILTPCKHAFCKDCIDRAMKVKSDGVGAQGACPICKRAITRRSLCPAIIINDLTERFNELARAYKKEYNQDWEEALAGNTITNGKLVHYHHDDDSGHDQQEEEMTQITSDESNVIVEIDAPPSSPSSSLFQSIHFSPLRMVMMNSLEEHHQHQNQQQQHHQIKEKEERQQEQYKLVSSLLSSENQKSLQKWSSHFGMTVSPIFDNNITHVITESRRPKRTIKTMLAILNGIWLVSIEWIKACLEKNKILPEEDFEVEGDDATKEPGPKRSRLSKQLKECKLFDGFSFYLYGSFERPEREDLIRLLTTGGALIIRTIEELDKYKKKTIKSHKKRVIILCDPEAQSNYETDIGITQHFKPFIAVSWLLDSISSYQIIDVTHYKVVG